MIQRLTFLIAFLAAAASASAQVVFTSPLPKGILQVRGNHADLRMHVTLKGYSNFTYKLSSDIDTSSLQDGWASVTIQNGIVDTLLTVPKSLRDYSLYWRTGLSSSDTGGVIAGLTPGHIMGVAGQSNAQGATWEMIEQPNGDIRMLTNDSTWLPAHEPTGGVAGGPWIVMSNILYQGIGDTLPIGIVNTAIGNTGLTIPIAGREWYRNPSNPEDSSVYGNAISRFRHAGSELETLCWIQGEADAGTLPEPNVYRVAFARLMAGFVEDLGDSMAVFHLQIGGYDLDNIDSWPEVREAERVLPPSTIVGTALGRSVDDGIHYSAATLWAVGEMFAGAILKERYGIDSAMYPPLMPDTVATLDSITDGSIVGRYCFSIGWNRNGIPAKISFINNAPYFALHKDGLWQDTSLVWYRISPRDSTRLLVGLRSASITLDHNWAITYDAISESDRAPVATIDPVWGDTIFGTAFFELPVQLPASANADVKEFSIQSVVPNPTSNAINCYVLSAKHQIVTIALYNDRGIALRRSSAVLESGTQDIPVSIGGLMSGNYWISLIDDTGQEIIAKAIVVN